MPLCQEHARSPSSGACSGLPSLRSCHGESSHCSCPPPGGPPFHTLRLGRSHRLMATSATRRIADLLSTPRRRFYSYRLLWAKLRLTNILAQCLPNLAGLAGLLLLDTEPSLGRCGQTSRQLCAKYGRNGRLRGKLARYCPEHGQHSHNFARCRPRCRPKFDPNRLAFRWFGLFGCTTYCSSRWGRTVSSESMLLPFLTIITIMFVLLSN